jgi:predicted nucleotidyltransferase
LSPSNEEIVAKVKRQVARKMAMKRGYRRKFKQIIERQLRKILYQVFSPKNVIAPCLHGSSMFGCDEFGRDVEKGLQQYVAILKSRIVEVHTVIVQGSRAKSSWKPESDVDVTIIANNLPKEGHNFLSFRLRDLRRRILLSDRPLFMGIEPSGCCSREEYLKRLERFDLQALDAILYGRVVFDDGFWSQVKSKYEELVKKNRLETAPLRELISPV